MTEVELNNLNEFDQATYGYLRAAMEKFHEDLTYERGVSFNTIAQAIGRKLADNKNQLLQEETRLACVLNQERKVLAMMADIAGRYFGVDFEAFPVDWGTPAKPEEEAEGS